MGISKINIENVKFGLVYYYSPFNEYRGLNTGD